MPTTRKTVLLGTDGSCAIQVDALAESLNRVCRHLRFAAPTEPFDLGPFVLSNPATYARLAAVTKPLIKKHASIIVGPNGQGPWQSMELRAFITEFADGGCPVNPVILADAPDVPELPLFLRQFTWVDFRKLQPDPWIRLIWGITGRKPN